MKTILRNSYVRRILILPTIAFVLLLSGFSSAVSAVVTIDTRSSNAAFSNTGVASLSWNHTVNNGISRALYVGVSTTSLAPIGAVCSTLPTCVDLGTLPNVNSFRVVSVTFNGTNLSRVGGVVSSDLNNTSEIFQLTNPEMGTFAIEITFSPLTTTHAVGGAVSFNGVDQTTPNGAFAVNFGDSNSPTILLSGAAAGDYVFDNVAIAPASGHLVPTSPQTFQWEGSTYFFDAYDVGAGSTKPQTGANETMSWLMTSAGPWAHAGVIVKSFSSTAASGSVSGKVLSPEHRAVANALVSVTGSTGEVLSARTNPFGYFTLPNVPLGSTYIVNVQSKRYIFAPTVLTMNEDVVGLTIISTGK